MGKKLAFLYGVLCYIIFLGAFLYAIGFIGDFGVPKTLDSGQSGVWLPALLIDLLALGIFAIQHSVMARPGFKSWWTKLVPKSVERSTYVLFASGALIFIYVLWHPLPGIVWKVQSPIWSTVLYGVYLVGWGIVLMATFMISHTHLFGLKQVHAFLQDRKLSPPKFQVTGFYRYIRHPIMAGFLIAFWATPRMTVGHLLFAAATTGYILIALQLEERDLLAHFGDRYRTYREQVPKLVPRGHRWNPRENRADGTA